MKRTGKETKEARDSYIKLCRADVEWYERQGKYPDRIARDSHFINYVIGDWAWNRKHPERYELVDAAMPSATSQATNRLREGRKVLENENQNTGIQRLGFLKDKRG